MGKLYCLLALLLVAINAQDGEEIEPTCCNHDEIQPLVEDRPLDRCAAYEEIGRPCPYASVAASGVDTDTESTAGTDSTEDDEGRRLDLEDGSVWVDFEITSDFSLISDEDKANPEIAEILDIVDDVNLWFSKAFKVRQFGGDSTILVP
jgi:hypothetical protein